VVYKDRQLAEALRSGDLKFEDDRTAVARFLSLIALPEPATPIVGGDAPLHR